MIGDFTPADVPDALLQKVVKDAKIHADILNAGPMAGTGLSPQAAADKGLTKNHWIWRVLIEGDAGATWQIQFGMNVKPVPSIDSMQGRYAGSSRSDPDSASGEVFSDIGSLNKPRAVDSQSKLVVVGGGGNGGGSDDSGPAEFSDVGSQDIPPSIRSSNGGFIQQPAEGVPVLGVFDIKVRGRVTPSHSAYTVRTFMLAGGTTFGQLLHALMSRGMEPFRFRKIGVAFLGCRDFISQAAAAWISDGLMLTGLCCEMPVQHIFLLLGWRYTRPLVLGNIDDDNNMTTEQGMGRTPNNIDRAVWPKDYVHHEDSRLEYNQPTDA